MQKVTLTINGRQIEATAGQPLLQAALDNGIHIPHYCYHPGLPVAGNCRMCLVEIEGMPKLQIACGTPVKEGLVARSDSPRVRQAVRHVLEFLLINHPVDCPVCDQAGECGLQEYYMQVGRYDSRFLENKVTKSKKAFPIGDWVILDQERCILCSRCVRFTREVTGTYEMAIFNRGDHAEIDTLPGRRLENRYSGNLVDVCPVGALTCRDFRFQCRVWYLKRTPSICPGCARGCNIEIHHNPERPHKGDGRRVFRLKPRFNPVVNRHWICDDGRYGYRSIDDGRVRHAELRQDGAPRQVYLREALDQLAGWLDEVEPAKTLCLLSADETNEALFATLRVFRESLGIPCLLPDTAIFTGDADDLLIMADKHPNTRGLREIFQIVEKDFVSAAALGERLRREPPRLLIVERQTLAPEVIEALQAAGCRLVYLGANHSGTSRLADLTLPLAAYAEQEGTFTNWEGRVQRISLAVPPLGEAAPLWELCHQLSRRLGLQHSFPSAAATFLQLAESKSFFRSMSLEGLAPFGLRGSHE